MGCRKVLSRWVAGSLSLALVAGCGPVSGGDVLGAMLDGLPAQGRLMLLAGDDGRVPANMPDAAGLMELIKTMAGTGAFDDDEDEDETYSPEAMAAIAAMQAGSTDMPSDTSGPSTGLSLIETELMTGLGGIPVQTGRVSADALRLRLLTPVGEE